MGAGRRAWGLSGLGAADLSPPSPLLPSRGQGSAVFDFSGTGPEVFGNLNAPRAITLSALIYCLRCLVGRDIPLNQVRGSMRSPLGGATAADGAGIPVLAWATALPTRPDSRPRPRRAAWRRCAW